MNTPVTFVVLGCTIGVRKGEGGDFCFPQTKFAGRCRATWCPCVCLCCAIHGYAACLHEGRVLPQPRRSTLAGTRPPSLWTLCIYRKLLIGNVWLSGKGGFSTKGTKYLSYGGLLYTDPLLCATLKGTSLSECLNECFSELVIMKNCLHSIFREVHLYSRRILSLEGIVLHMLSFEDVVYKFASEGVQKKSVLH